MKIKHYIILIFFALMSLKNFATHIVGGEIYYDCLGGNNYRITLKLYRDCFNGIPPYDNPASIFIFNSMGTYLDSLQVPAPASVVLPFPLSNPCLTPPTNICVEEAIYQVVVNLPPLAGGYNFTYARCCRNGTILNLIDPGNVGSTYMAHIPDPGLATCNSSPHYNNFPPIFICAGVPLNFDHSATDPDGDSLYYQLCDAFVGLDASCPILGPQSASGCNPIATSPPPPFVPYLSPYNGAYPMSSSPALTVNPVTGLMTGTPNLIGQWVVAVCVSEYRNGVLLDVNKRDFQFNVVNCGIPVASIPSQQPFCFGSPSNFSQASINAFTYHWDFGEVGINQDTSNIISPTWTYSSLGTYTVTLIVNPWTLCADTATLSVTVNPLPAMTSANSAAICDGATLNIPLSSSIPSDYAWVATNNANTTGESTTTQTGSPIDNTLSNNTAVAQNVIYSVTPTSNPGSCVGSPQTVTVTVNPSPTMTSPPNATICTGTPVNIPLTSDLPSTYTWIAADNTNTTGESTTLQTGSPLNNTITSTSALLQAVVYTVTATSTANSCVGDPQSVTVSVVPLPIMTSPASASICSGDTVSIPLTSNVSSTYTWIAANNANTTGESTTTQTGSPLSDNITNNVTTDQTVSYSVTPTSNPDGCIGNPFAVAVTVYHGLTADFDFVTVPCTNQVTFNDSSAVGPVSWLWYFDDGDSSVVQNPSHTFDTTGIYNVQLIAATANDCRDTVEVQINFTGAVPVSVTSNPTICLGNSTQLIATGGFAYSWTPAIALSDTAISDPIAGPDTNTTYTVAISTINTFGDTCVQTLTTAVTAIDPSLYSIAATAENDTIIEGESTVLHAITDTSLAVNWVPTTGVNNTTSFDPTVTPESTTTYTVSILDSAGCPKMATITVYVMSKECDVADVFVPNTFTPNADGNNDVLYVRGKQLTKLYFAVYNRRGELIFETYDITKGWDGTYKGLKSDPDVFAWYLSGECFNGDKMKNKGNVTLIR